MFVSDDLKEQKFEALLKPALYEQMLQELQNQEFPNTKHQFAKTFDKKMNRLIKKNDINENCIKNFKSLTAAGLFVVVMSGFLTMNVDALRVPIWNLFMGDEYSVIDYGGKKEEIEIPVEYEDYVPGYVMSGYELVYAYGDEKRCYLQYSNIDGMKYYIMIYLVDTREAFDTEEGVVSEKRIGEHTVTMMEKDGEIWVDFRKNNTIYTINGNAEEVIERDIEKILDSI